MSEAGLVTQGSVITGGTPRVLPRANLALRDHVGFLIQFPEPTSRAGSVVRPLLQMRKLRHKAVNWPRTPRFELKAPNLSPESDSGCLLSPGHVLPRWGRGLRCGSPVYGRGSERGPALSAGVRMVLSDGF